MPKLVKPLSGDVKHHFRRKVSAPLVKKAMTRFSLRLPALRIAKQMSQAEVGQIVGVSRAAVSQWEKGKTMPEIQHLQELARFFDVPLTYLVGDESPKASIDEGLRMLPKDVSDALRASFLSTIEAVKNSKK